MPNPNFNYRGLPNYGYPNRNENIGLLIGTLLGAGLGAAGGENTADALLRGGAGGIASYGSGLRGIQDYNTDAFKQQTIADNLLYQPEEQERARGMYDMAKDKFDWERMKDVNFEIPLSQSYAKHQNALTERLLNPPSPPPLTRHEKRMERYQEGKARNDWINAKNKPPAKDQNELNRKEIFNEKSQLENEIWQIKSKMANPFEYDPDSVTPEDTALFNKLLTDKQARLAQLNGMSGGMPSQASPGAGIQSNTQQVSPQVGGKPKLSVEQARQYMKKFGSKEAAMKQAIADGFDIEVD